MPSLWLRHQETIVGFNCILEQDVETENVLLGNKKLSGEMMAVFTYLKDDEI